VSEGRGEAAGEVIVREIQPTEGAQLRAIRLRALADSPSAFCSTLAETATRPPSYWDARARGDTGSQESTLFIAEGPNGWVGLIGCFGEEPGDVRSVELTSMWVDPVYRSRGVGRRLVEQVVDWARRRGAGSVWLWVTDGNTAAASLYARCGFRDTGETQPHPSNPALRECRMVLEQ